MAPIRVGLIGLSGAPPSEYEGTNWALSAHLPYLLASPHYTITALLNRSISSARAAIERYNLPSDTKAYGDPVDLANDEDIDLVVCSTRVDRHLDPVRPSLIAGKSVYIEWPLEASLTLAREAATLAAKHNATTLVGLQASFSPLIRKIKELIDAGKLGRVVSSTWQAALGNAGGVEGKNVRYFVDRSVGGNVISIGVGHSLEFLNHVLGDFKSFDSRLSIGYPTVNIIDRSDGSVLDKGVVNTVPDHIHLQGIVTSNAVVSYTWRGGPSFPDTPRADWRIVGTEGELRLTSPGWSLNVGQPETKLEFFDKRSGKVEIVTAEKDEWDEMPVPAQNIGRLYEAYRKGESVPDFQSAIKRHEFLEELWSRFDEEQKN